MFTFGIKEKIIPIVVVDILIILLGLISEKTINLEAIFFSHYASIITIIAQYVIPVVMFIGYGVKYFGKNRGIKNEKEIKNDI